MTTQYPKDHYTKAVQEHGSLPAHSFPGSYPIIYLRENNDVLCAACATKEAEEITYHTIHWEGSPFNCTECNEEIESAYGEVEEEG